MRFAGMTLRIGRIDDGDKIPTLLPRQNLRIARQAQHPQPAFGIKIDRNRIDDVRLARVKLDVEPFGQLKQSLLNLRIITHRVVIGANRIRQRQQADSNHRRYDPGSTHRDLRFGAPNEFELVRFGLALPVDGLVHLGQLLVI